MDVSSSRLVRAAAGLVFIAGIVFFAMNGLQFSIVEDTKKDTVNFYHASSDAGPRNEVFRTARSSDDTGYIHDLKIDIGEEFEKYDYCALEPQVYRNGDRIDPWGSHSSIKTCANPDGCEDTGDNSLTVDVAGTEMEMEFAYFHYMDEQWYGGYYYGVECQGTTSIYRLAIPFDKISVDTTVPDEVEAGEQIPVAFEFTNGFVPLVADVDVSVCIDGQFCESVQRNVSVPTGQHTETIMVDSPESGSVSVDVAGTLGIDLDRFRVEDVAVRCDGSLRSASECSTITVAEIGGGGVTEVNRPLSDQVEDIGDSFGVVEFARRSRPFGWLERGVNTVVFWTDLAPDAESGAAG